MSFVQRSNKHQNLRISYSGIVITIKSVLIDFSLTVKVATLISGSAISSFKQGKSGDEELISCLGRANVRVFHENPNRLSTELTFINP